MSTPTMKEFEDSLVVLKGAPIFLKTAAAETSLRILLQLLKQQEHRIQQLEKGEQHGTGQH